MDPDASIPGDPEPSVFSYVLSFLLVGVAWGFTTPFIRRAAADFNARQEKQSDSATSISDRGRSHTQSPVEPALNGEEEQQELLPQYEQDGEGVRRTSGSRQREEAGRLAGEGQEGDVDATPAPAWMQSSDQQQSWLKAKIVSIFWTVVNLLRTPAYSIPLVINLTGSIWFFLLVGKHELSLTVPLANSSAFLFTVLGEWYVERKVIAKETWLGLILVLGGIALCVHSKNQTV
ncbi:Putative Integral membrane protein [Penicillium brasilianum]|uniref:Putative Integral membrane protein n=1 Tax=Penicillium brasilianum TaxID=104259 RepID=A0A0F7TQE3_PENBI|nr:Putative Integral membrane protein [Penicillium brasilianum]